VIDQLRRLTGIRKIGHAGTLDPLASGLLILGIGAATKRLGSLVGLDKHYEGEITLGSSSTTDDAEGDLTATSGEPPERVAIERALNSLRGRISQLPPQYSARKLAGKKAYELARAGKEARLEARPVEVFSFEITDYDYSRLTFRCHVSSGTFVRSLARDLGAALGVGGYLSGLRRTMVGPYRVEDATAPEGLGADWRQKLFNPAVE
jgi:tRNA pseudouridine55 synthase